MNVRVARHQLSCTMHKNGKTPVLLKYPRILGIILEWQDTSSIKIINETNKEKY